MKYIGYYNKDELLVVMKMKNERCKYCFCVKSNVGYLWTDGWRYLRVTEKDLKSDRISNDLECYKNLIIKELQENEIMCEVL